MPCEIEEYGYELKIENLNDLILKTVHSSDDIHVVNLLKAIYFAEMDYQKSLKKYSSIKRRTYQRVLLYIVDGTYGLSRGVSENQLISFLTFIKEYGRNAS